jgi:hypothetical protein
MPDHTMTKKYDTRWVVLGSNEYKALQDQGYQSILRQARPGKTRVLMCKPVGEDTDG